MRYLTTFSTSILNLESNGRNFSWFGPILRKLWHLKHCIIFFFSSLKKLFFQKLMACKGLINIPKSIFSSQYPYKWTLLPVFLPNMRFIGEKIPMTHSLTLKVRSPEYSGHTTGKIHHIENMSYFSFLNKFCAIWPHFQHLH